MSASVAALLWHERLNQILVGTGESSYINLYIWHVHTRRLRALPLLTGNRKSGSCRVLYDPSYSEKGVLLSAARAPRAANPLDFEVCWR